MKNVFIVGGGFDYAHMFMSFGMTVVEHITNADLICFTGGADVDPSFYGDKPHPYTHSSLQRDRSESLVFKYGKDNNLPMVGICRGAQFLNVMSGGRMYQHVEGHTRSHEITDLLTGESIFVSSTHHQMMMPSSEALLVASSRMGGNREWFDYDVFKKDVSKEDIEVVFYEKTKCLCFQPHPEFVDKYYVRMTQYFNELLERFFKA